MVLNKLYQADKLVCLGDIVGYGPNPNECIEKVRGLNIPTVLGNHDAVVIGAMESTWFNLNAREAIEWTKQEITPQNLEYLRGIPEVMEEDGFQMVHGSLREPLEEYITGIAEALPTFEKMTKPVCFIGHSHVPLFIALKKDGNYEGRMLSDGDEILVEDYKKTIVNIGGVGQPRDGDPRASYGTYDSKTKIFSLHRVEYNIKRVQEKMEKAGLPQPLIDRLQFGR